MEQLNALMSLFIPVSAIVFGLVEFLKNALNLNGPVVTVVSFITGAVVGGAVFIAYQFPQAQIYVYGALFILTTGLVSSGFYKFSSTFRR
jgi:hypothetical protein